jgi:RNA-binding protein YhbY
MSNLWKRLGPWLPGGEGANDGDAALRALADVAEARRSLEQAELLAVRVARRHRKSWTEIATMLTISRQAAWERWRELDPQPDSTIQPDDRERVTEAVATELVARAGRRRLVKVPDLVGLSLADALTILTRSGLEAVSATPDISLQESQEDLRPIIVVRQYPDPDARIYTASTVKLWLERGDGEAGVREPRRPSPPPRVARAQRDELTEEAVG